MRLVQFHPSWRLFLRVSQKGMRIGTEWKPVGIWSTGLARISGTYEPYSASKVGGAVELAALLDFQNKKRE